MTATAAVSRFAGRGVCSRCLARIARPASSETLYRSSIHTKRKLHSGLIPDKQAQQNMLISSPGWAHNYFSANDSIDRGWVKNGVIAAWRTVAESPKSKQKAPDENTRESTEAFEMAASSDSVVELGTRPSNAAEPVVAPSPPPKPLREQSTLAQSQDETLPHRRRRRKSTDSPDGENKDTPLPLDASSQLTMAASAMPSSALLRRRFATYLSLTKPRLSFLVLLTTTAAYSLYPIPDILSSTASSVDMSQTLSTSTLTFLFLTTGTFLSCACANSLNMLFEPKYDALMTRTRNRPLVRNLVSRRAAAVFALLCGGSGLLLLDLGTNPTVAGLSALNIFLYAFVYTPMKRISPVNTWVGALVGGIPPLMGWCAAAGQAATSEHHSWKDLLFSETSIGGWLCAALLFAWQFPHFMSLSHMIRDDYRNAGHKMLSWTNPARNARVGLRYSFAMFPICAGLYWAGYVNQGFLVISTACNLWMTREAIRFWRKQGAGGSARGLFWASVWQLPLVLVGALVCKRGIWDGFLSSREDAVSVYDDENHNDIDRDGEALNMEAAAASQDGKSHKIMHDINLAMMGFKRPS